MIIYFTTIKGRRDSNEDRHNIILNINKLKEDLKDINLFGIYDGHGGTYVSNFLEKNMPNYYCDKNIGLPICKNFHIETFEKIQQEILKNDKGYTSGSTCLLNIMYKQQDEIHMNIVNLGDCRTVIVYKNGKHKQVTTDHKPDDPFEKNRLTKMGGEVYKDSEGTFRIGDLSLSRAFGDADNAPYISQKPDIFYKKITSLTKYVVMGCDGLWDVIKNEELFELLNKFKENGVDNLAVELAKHALNVGTTDNVSIIIIEL